MSPSPYQRYPASPWQRAPFVLLVVIVGVVGLAALLVVGGVALPYLRKVPATKARPEPAGTPVLVSARLIPAYTKISRDHVLDAKTAEFTVVYLPPESASRENFLSFDKIVGRVLKVRKPGGYAFREDDFYPEGTRPGVAAGVPLGKKAFVVDADKLPGSSSFLLGDRVDLLASLPVDMDKTLGKYRKGGVGRTLLHEPDTVVAELPKRASVKAVAQNVLIVQPVTARPVPVGDAVLGRDGKPKMRLIHEIILAVAPEEVGPLTEAITVNAHITAVAHSGLPGERAQETPGMPSLAPRVIVVEAIVGKKRDLLVFPAPSEAPKRRAPRPKPVPSIPDLSTSP